MQVIYKIAEKQRKTRAGFMQLMDYISRDSFKTFGVGTSDNKNIAIKHYLSNKDLHKKNRDGKDRFTYHVMASFGVDVPIETVIEIMEEFCTDNFYDKGFNSFFAIHTDTNNIHCHVIADNVNFNTGNMIHSVTEKQYESMSQKKKDKAETFVYEHQRKLFEDICIKHGLDISLEERYEYMHEQKQKEGRKWLTKEQYRAKKDKDSWTNEIKDKLEQIYKNEDVNEDNIKDIAGKYALEVTRHNKDKKYITFALLDEQGKRTNQKLKLVQELNKKKKKSQDEVTEDTVKLGIKLDTLEIQEKELKKDSDENIFIYDNFFGGKKKEIEKEETREDIYAFFEREKEKLRLKKEKEAEAKAKEVKEDIKPVEEVKEDIKPVKEVKEDIKPVEEVKEDIKPVEEVKEDIKPVEEVKEDIKPVEEVKEDIKPVKEVKEDIKPVEEVKEDIKPVEEVKEDIKPVEEVKEDIKPVEEVKEDIKPVEEVKEDIKPVEEVKEDIKPVEEVKEDIKTPVNTYIVEDSKPSDFELEKEYQTYKDTLDNFYKDQQDKKKEQDSKAKALEEEVKNIEKAEIDKITKSDEVLRRLNIEEEERQQEAKAKKEQEEKQDLESKESKQVDLDSLMSKIDSYKLVEEYNLYDTLPPFQIFTDELIYNSETGEGEIELAKSLIVDVKGEEYWKNMNLKDITKWEETGVFTIAYAYDSMDNFKEFAGYEDYSKSTIKQFLEINTELAEELAEQYMPRDSKKKEQDSKDIEIKKDKGREYDFN